MKLIELNNDRNGKIAAAVYTIICLFFLFALKCETPKEEYAMEGVQVNLGFTETGKSENVPEAVEEIQEEVTPQEQVEEVVSEVVEESVTQETEAVDVTASEQVTEATEATEEPVEELSEEAVEEAEEVVEQQVDQSALFNSTNNNPNQGDGDEDGDKGNENGSLESNIYGDITGPGLGDTGKGWGLNGRSLGNKPKPVSEKQEYGSVTIKIKVAKNGKVINAQFSSKGSTTTDSYLVNLSITEAYKVTFNPDNNAPDVQVGFVTFHYKPN